MSASVNIGCIRAIEEDSAGRPFWSVMIPTFNPRIHQLSEAIESVLAQDPGQAQMEIGVVDDFSSRVDVGGLVAKIAGNRIAVFRTSENLGLAGCWNMCIQMSKGHWIHLLHQDDAVLPGFYDKVKTAISSHPGVSLAASRSFMVDGEGIIESVTKRLPNLESGGRDASDFYYSTPIQCPGVVVKRRAYETLGGFRSDLKFALDCEMWARVISEMGGLVLPAVLALYRSSSANESSRLWRTSEALRDLETLNRLFAERYPGFELNKANRKICQLAIWQAQRLAQQSDQEGVMAIRRYWKKHVPLRLRLEHVVVETLRRIALWSGLSPGV